MTLCSCFVITARIRIVSKLSMAGLACTIMSRAYITRLCATYVQGTRRSLPTNMSSSLPRNFINMKPKETILREQSIKVDLRDIRSVSFAGNDSMETTSCSCTSEKLMSGASFVTGEMKEERRYTLKTSLSYSNIFETTTSRAWIQNAWRIGSPCSVLNWTCNIINWRSMEGRYQKTNGETQGRSIYLRSIIDNPIRNTEVEVVEEVGIQILKHFLHQQHNPCQEQNWLSRDKWLFKVHKASSPVLSVVNLHRPYQPWESRQGTQIKQPVQLHETLLLTIPFHLFKTQSLAQVLPHHLNHRPPSHHKNNLAVFGTTQLWSEPPSCSKTTNPKSQTFEVASPLTAHPPSQQPN